MLASVAARLILFAKSRLFDERASAARSVSGSLPAALAQ